MYYSCRSQSQNKHQQHTLTLASIGGQPTARTRGRFGLRMWTFSSKPWETDHEQGMQVQYRIHQNNSCTTSYNLRGACNGRRLRIYGFTDLPPSLPLLPGTPFTRITESSYRRVCVPGTADQPIKRHSFMTVAPERVDQAQVPAAPLQCAEAHNTHPHPPYAGARAR